MDIFSEIVIIILLLFILAALIKAFWGSKQILKQVKSASPLNKNLSIGCYVKFTGILSFPQTNTPFHKISCAYWRLDIRGIFKTKKKKPSKGWDTHQPSIYNNSMHHQPILLHNDNIVVHMEFHPRTHVMQDMLYKSTTQKQCPENISPSICQSKYKQYKITESWYPVNKTLTVIGKLVAIDNCTYTICESHHKERPPIVTSGSIEEFNKRHSRRARNSISLIFMTLIAYCYVTFILQATGLSWEINLAFGIVILIIWWWIDTNGKNKA